MHPPSEPMKMDGPEPSGGAGGGGQGPEEPALIAGLPADLAPFVAAERDSGVYRHESDLVAAAFRALKAERERERSDHRVMTAEDLRFAYEAAGLGTWDVDARTGTRMWSREFRAICGFGPDVPADPARFTEVIHPDDRQWVVALYGAVMSGAEGGHYHAEFRILRADDGAERTVITIGRYVFDEEGHAVRGVGCIMDVTARRRAEADLRESETRLEIACEAAELGIWDVDLESEAVIYTPRARAIAGLPAEGLIDLTMIRAGMHPDDRPRTSAITERALDPELREKTSYEYRIVRPDGATRWVLAHGEAVFAERKGKVRAVRYVGTIQDVTERREALERLQESEARLRLAVEAGRMAIWQWYPHEDRLVGSAETWELLGFPRGVSPTIDEVRAGFLPGEAVKVDDAIRAARERGESFFEAVFRYRAGEGLPRWLMLRAEIRRRPDRRIGTIVGVLLDVTEQRRGAEQKQLLLDELNHRVKNTLATVVSIASQTLKTASDLPSARDNLEVRLVALARAHDVLTSENWEGAGLHDIVARAIAPHRGEDDERFTLGGPVLRLPPRTALVFALALHELATNAVKYGALSAPGGRVGIRWGVAADGAGKRVLSFRWEESGGPMVVAPRRRGFGSRLIERSLAYELTGRVELAFPPSGVVCAIEAPLQ